MRNNGILKAIVVSSSAYSKTALAFVKERPIELIDKNGLQDLLKLATV